MAVPCILQGFQLKDWETREFMAMCRYIRQAPASIDRYIYPEFPILYRLC